MECKHVNHHTIFHDTIDPGETGDDIDDELFLVNYITSMSEAEKMKWKND